MVLNNKDKNLVSVEYQPFDGKQPGVHFGERTGIQSVITSPWVLRWASIPATYQTYRAIRKHGTIAMARELKVAPVLASDWTVESDDDAPDEWKTLIEKIFFPLRDEFLAAALYYGDVDFGYQCFEKVIEPKDGYLKLVRLKPLLHDITEICIGHQGGFIGVRQLGKDLGLANSVHVGFRVEGSYFYGIPLLEHARQAYNWWVDCNEGARRYDRKIAGAHIVVEYPLGSSIDRNGHEVENAVLARTVLDNLEAAGGVAVPRDMAAFMQQLNLESPGWKIWILDAGASQQASFCGRLEYLDKQLCRCMHIPERAMMEGQHGTLAEAEAHSDVVFTIQDIEHRRVTDELNRQAVDQMLSLNFGKGAVGKVRLKASPIVDEKKAYFKQIYAMLLGGPAGQKELQSLDAASLREQLGLPQVQNDPGDVEHEGANLQAIPGLSAGQPGGEGKGMMAQGPDGQPVTVPGNADNPAAAMANAVWGMREAVALSSTALRKAEEWAKNSLGFISHIKPEDQEAAVQTLHENSGIPMWELALDNDGEEQSGDTLALAGTEPVEQEPWQEDPRFTHGDLGYKTKSVPLGDKDYLNFESLTNREGEDPDVEDARAANDLDYPHEILVSRGPTRTGGANGRFDITGEGKAGEMISHSAQALRELINKYKPVSIEFSANEESRQKAYHHMMRRLSREGAGNGEYAFLHEPGRFYKIRGGGVVNSKPGYFHIVHMAAADLPRYRDMKEVGAREKVAMANSAMPVLKGRAVNEPGLSQDYLDHIAKYGSTGYFLPSNPEYRRTLPQHKQNTAKNLGQIADSILEDPAWYVEGSSHHGSMYLRHKDTGTRLRVSTHAPQHNAAQADAYVHPQANQEWDERGLHSMRYASPKNIDRLINAAIQHREEGFPDEFDWPDIHLDNETGEMGDAGATGDACESCGYNPCECGSESQSDHLGGKVGSGHSSEMAMAGTMSDVLAARPIFGQPSEKMNTVAMANLQNEQDPWGMQRKSISEAIDAPEYRRPTSVSPGMQILLALRARRRGEEGGYVNMSPGQKILFELRARRGARFANEPAEAAFSPKMQQPDSTPVAEYLGHGPTAEGKYGISFKTPEGDQQHLGVKGMKPIESGESENPMMHVTFHDNSTATMRVPSEHRRDIIGQMLKLLPKPNASASIAGITTQADLDRIAQKRSQLSQEAQSEYSQQKSRESVQQKIRDKKVRAGGKPTGITFEMPDIPYVRKGGEQAVSPMANDIITNDFRNKVIPAIVEHHGRTPELREELAGSMRNHEIGTAIAGSLGRYGEQEVRDEEGNVDPLKVQDYVPLIYGLVLKDAEKWRPGMKETVKDKKTGETSEKPISFETHVLRSIWRNVTRLTRTERYDPNAPTETSIHGKDDTEMPISDSDIDRGTAAEDEMRNSLANTWMSAYLDKAGMDIFQDRAKDPSLKRVRSRYGDQAVDERIRQIDQLSPMFDMFVESGYQMPEGSQQFMPPAPTTPAKNVTDIKDWLLPHERAFFRKFTDGMPLNDRKLVRLIYTAKRAGLRVPEDLYGHPMLPPGNNQRSIKNMSGRLRQAASAHKKETGVNLHSNLVKQPEYKTRRTPYVEEPEHHAGLEEFIREKLSREGASPPVMKILTQTLLGNVMPNRLYDDPELTQLARNRRLESIAKHGKGVGSGPIADMNAKNFVRDHTAKFKQWIPEYFKSIGRSDLAQKYLDKDAELKASHSQSNKAARGLVESVASAERVKRSHQKDTETRRRGRRGGLKQSIDRGMLNLDALPPVLEAEFSRPGQGRRIAHPKEKADFVMKIIEGRLNHKTVSEIIKEPDVQRIIRLPGFFQGRVDVDNPKKIKSLVEHYWGSTVMSILEEKSPILAGLLKENHHKFKNKYHPLSQSKEIIEPMKSSTGRSDDYGVADEE